MSMPMLAVIVTTLLLPGFSPMMRGPAGGQVLEGTFPGTERPGYVYLPPGFNEVTHYPVVYLLHGLRGSPEEYIAATQLPVFADTEIAAGRLRPFIAVVPAAGATADYDGEWAGQWEHALVDQIVPWIDARLPTEPNAAGRVIAGLSAGGYGAVDIGLRHPSLFKTVESWGGYFTPVLDGPFKHATRAVLAAHDPTRIVEAEQMLLVEDQTRFFLSTGPRTAAGRRRRRRSTTPAACEPSGWPTRCASTRANRVNGAISWTTASAGRSGPRRTRRID